MSTKFEHDFQRRFQRRATLILYTNRRGCLVREWLSYTLCLVRRWFVGRKSTQRQRRRRESDSTRYSLLIHSCPARGAARRWAGGRARVLLKGPSISGRICRQYILPQHNRERRPLRNPFHQVQGPLISAEIALRWSGRKHFHLLGIG